MLLIGGGGGGGGGHTKILLYIYILKKALYSTVGTFTFISTKINKYKYKI